ncbi:MAG: hypothetical protein KF861_04845 [Planctomycetaceae bacterium]|nr:hypothetical protein [Planctomycetaceae bacterium]
MPVLVSLVLVAATCAGCGFGKYGEAVEPGGGIPEYMAIQEARAMVYVLEHLVQEGKLKETARLYDQMGYIYSDPASARHFKGYEETYVQLQSLAAEVKELLIRNQEDVESIKSRVQKMVELADDLPGDTINIAEVWSVD